MLWFPSLIVNCYQLNIIDEPHAHHVELKIRFVGVGCSIKPFSAPDTMLSVNLNEKKKKRN